jgi:hypothetical protein
MGHSCSLAQRVRGNGGSGTCILAEQALTATTVEAVVAQLRVVCCDAVADLDACHFGAHGGYHADGFVAWDERELGNELSFVDVLCHVSRSRSPWGASVSYQVWMESWSA